jgi:competence protein ComEA
MHESPRPDLPRPDPLRPLPAPARGIERLREHWDDPRVRIGALLAAALVTGLVWYQLGASASTEPAGPPPASAVASASTTRAATGPTAASGSSGMLTVHVAGDVARPGVVRVSAGARVVDAIEAAGGGLPDADLDRLNLAAKVADGQRVAVAKIGAPAPIETGATTGDPAGGSDATAGPLNINTATSTQLEELPGIGPSLAAAIIAEREKRGGFTAVTELQDVRGIGELRYADIKDLVSV